MIRVPCGIGYISGVTSGAALYTSIPDSAVAVGTGDTGRTGMPVVTAPLAEPGGLFGTAGVSFPGSSDCWTSRTQPQVPAMSRNTRRRAGTIVFISL